MLNRHVERLGKGKTSAAVAARKLATLGPQFLLLRGDGMVPPNLSDAKVEAIIHWGLPRTGHCRHLYTLQLFFVPNAD